MEVRPRVTGVGHCRRIVLGASAAVMIVAGLGCRRGESNPNAALVSQQGHETADLLESRAESLTQGPEDPVTRQAVEDLRASARTIRAHAEEQAAQIRTHETSGRGGGPIPRNVVPDLVVNARCEYEAQCGHVGPGRRYQTAEACVQRLADDRFTRWSPTACGTRSFDNEALYNCLSAVRAQSCSALDLTMLNAACDPARVCPPH